MDFLPQCYHGVFVSEDFIAFEINLRFEDCGGEMFGLHEMGILGRNLEKLTFLYKESI